MSIGSRWMARYSPTSNPIGSNAAAARRHAAPVVRLRATGSVDPPSAVAIAILRSYRAIRRNHARRPTAQLGKALAELIITS